MGADFARAGTVVLSSLPHQLLHLDHWLSISHALPSDVAVTGRELSLFLNPASAGWTTLKSQSAYCPVSY